METRLKDRQRPTKTESLKVAEIETSSIRCSDTKDPQRSGKRLTKTQQSQRLQQPIKTIRDPQRLYMETRLRFNCMHEHL